MPRPPLGRAEVLSPAAGRAGRAEDVASLEASAVPEDEALRGEALRVRGAARVALRGLRESAREPERVEERGMMNSWTAVCALQQSELQCSTRRV